jgi:hypothetical protein
VRSDAGKGVGKLIQGSLHIRTPRNKKNPTVATKQRITFGSLLLPFWLQCVLSF